MTKRERRAKIQEMILSPVLELARHYAKADKNLKRIQRKIDSAKCWKTRKFYISKRDRTLDNMHDMVKQFIQLCEDEHVARIFDDPKYCQLKIIDAL
jgi:hypothetical protein